MTDYVLSKDIINANKEYKKVFPKTRDKIMNGVGTFFHFVGRYAPLPFEIDGVRRIVDRQYILGSLELLGAEYWRIKNYYSVKEKKQKIERERLYNEKCGNV